MMKKLLFFTILLGVFGCEKDSLPHAASGQHDGHDEEYCNELCHHTNSPIGDKIFEKDGKTWLWGGYNDDWHFDISNLSLDVKGFKFGLGREIFEALMEPLYKDVSEFQPDFFRPEDQFIMVEGASVKKAYPFDLMIQHEVINDVMEGEPFMVGYCVLADFAAVYSRKYCDEVFTFAVSGYTYFQDGIYEGKDGFVLWDRDSESLWWPLINKAVSGEMKGRKFNEDIGHLTWSIDTWENIREIDQLQILQYNQTMEPPLDYPRIDVAEICD